MKKPCLIIFLSLILTALNAQDFPEFGKFTQKEVDLIDYPEDPEAVAVVLFDIGRTEYIEKGNSLAICLRRHTRIKILKEAGIDQANVALQYYANGYGKTESIIEIKASSNVAEGIKISSVSLDKNDIFDEKINEYWRVKRFSIPGVKVGSIIEFEYVHISPFMYNLPDWEFQRDIPTLKSLYQVKMVPFYEYVVIKPGGNDLIQNSYIENSIGRHFAGVDFKNMVHVFEMNNIPAFYDDEFITSRNDYIRKLDFQLSKFNSPRGSQSEIDQDWVTVAKKLNKDDNFGKYIKSVQKSANLILPTLQLDAKSDLKKIEAISGYMKNQFRFNDYYGKYASQKVKNLENLKSGNVADLNLYLVGLLRAAGLEANPVILSTRQHGKVYREYPITSRFNYVIALVNIGDGMLLLDITQPILPYYLLPLRCINDYGLEIKEDPTWINLESQFYSTKTDMSIIQLSGDSLIVRSNERTTGYDAYLQRQSCLADEQEYIQAKLTETEQLTKAATLKNLNNYDELFSIEYSTTTSQTMFDSIVYITPFRNLEFGQNPLKRKKRDYPVDMIYKRERNLTSTIYIPEHMKIKSLPESLNFDNDLLSMKYEAKNMNNAVVIEASYKLKKSVYQPAEYDLLKGNLALIYKHLQNQLALEYK